MTDKMKKERVCLMMTPDEITAIDDWRYSHRVPSRADAIRKLLQFSLDAEKAVKKQAKDPDK
jgi:hypothetical protein